MSFAYLTLYTGDYLRDTRHLTPLRHGVYLLLLIYCWDSRGPVPMDEQECAGIANCRSQDEIEALRYVIGKFFVRMEDGHYNHRMQREIEKANAISNVRSNAGKRGYEAKAKHLPSKWSASASNPTPTPTPTTNLTPDLTGSSGGVETSKQKAMAKPAQAPFVLPDWIPAQQWDAWIESRAKARKSPTEFAKRLAVAKLDDLREQGSSPAAVLAQSAFNGWSGLFPLKT